MPHKTVFAVNVWSFLASGFGAGYAPRAPGTAGSLLGLGFGAALLSAGHLALLCAVLVLSALGLRAIGELGNAAQDPGWIVIDEIAGQMLALCFLPRLSIFGLLVSFLLFRLFDIWKPGPVGWADRRHDEYGVMGDDILAGLMAGAVLLALRLVSGA